MSDDDDDRCFLVIKKKKRSLEIHFELFFFFASNVSFPLFFYMEQFSLITRNNFDEEGKPLSDEHHSRK